MKILLSILEVGLPANVDNAHFWSRRGAVKLKVKHRLRTSTLLGSFLTVSDEKSTPFSADFLISVPLTPLHMYARIVVWSEQ